MTAAQQSEVELDLEFIDLLDLLNKSYPSTMVLYILKQVHTDTRVLDLQFDKYISPLLTSRNIFSNRIIQAMRDTVFFNKIVLPNGTIVPCIVKNIIDKKKQDMQTDIYPILSFPTRSGRVYFLVQRISDTKTRIFMVNGHLLQRVSQRVEEVPDNLSDKSILVFNSIVNYDNTLIDANSNDLCCFVEEGLLLGYHKVSPYEKIKTCSVFYYKTFLSNDMMTYKQKDLRNSQQLTIPKLIRGEIICKT